MPNRTNGVKEYTWGAKRSKGKLIAVLAIVLIAGATVAGFLFFSREEKSAGPTVNVNGEEMIARKIDGVLVPVQRSNLFPVGVMIENLVSSRPPSGLSEANVVYEALAEGGITRFLALYASGYEIPKIGPIRSARLYYLDWVQEYGALYAHVGGSPEALQQIAAREIFDFNQFFNSQYFWRDTDRSAPHNVYTSSEKLTFALRDLEAQSEGGYDSWAFKEDAPQSSRPVEGKTIEIDFSSINYRVSYQYDLTENTYIRSLGGKLHVDSDDRQVKAKNVIVQFVETSLSDGEGRLSMKTTGEGRVLVFRDGAVIEGTWRKDSSDARTEFFDSTNTAIELNAGTIWVEVVPSDREVTYT
ncbi:MAG: hypothetical protein A2898_04835 [Candidatus Kerfeldbacteria bacterium RIFCSPLOWO2_01_FULL_48_11]|uniref:DUF3048 domain-containing protein n=1 Tax=Candidatus Kerfeldbacteria bacterium RIFCSPLOWO2_01_FULL_48_11 TaxID=1798543 RepID=A0A1G2B2H9_9BACT|nr:MAG: hypothetical protein UY34_C0032G0005 [Parcubacteria group bacterium GW2011_GWA2_48_9]KKW15691.1 MAG: hypothetical protein UY52_C0016G0068 [Parcubacteria group bacterium GW2011_GWC2_49_9]OGY82879.1 MAG: hypothetical protein A2898_04835 [Candidatus Kerfeldbacteria bacterium RIFCSPLOWO2_01_FULL_48_11]HCJ52103.1 DUF3048 domain-containing protein [Candidatus Kerfeldbacteria bacterium]HCM68426.1 DUF3048 domain-containing protein [Candidatus Kerfeldbacteria bacterium]